jgi:hypothetical protein
MLWNAATLESMTTWREYYDETVVPQGTMYDYIWGNMTSSRDLAQQALLFCHTNPAVARSTLRFIMKRTLPDGTIQLNDEGFGWVPSGVLQTSDQQLYFFLLLAEYLRVTRDVSILTETIGYYPLENSGRDTGLAHVHQVFIFLRDRVGTASHGIICLWNSDWNDRFGWWPSDIPYNTEFAVWRSSRPAPDRKTDAAPGNSRGLSREWRFLVRPQRANHPRRCHLQSSCRTRPAPPHDLQQLRRSLSRLLDRPLVRLRQPRFLPASHRRPLHRYPLVRPRPRLAALLLSLSE